MTKLEFIYDTDCPNVNPARESLGNAVAAMGLDLNWIEWDRGDPQSPAYVHGYGSPTVLVNGRIVVQGGRVQTVNTEEIMDKAKEIQAEIIESLEQN